MSYGIKSEKKAFSSIPKSPQYLVQGWRWFDKVNGNTYHTIMITDLKTGKEV